MTSELETPRRRISVVYGLCTFLCAAAWVFFTGVAFLWAVDVLLDRGWRIGAVVAGYGVLVLVTARTTFAMLAWFAAGSAAIGLCMLAANHVWPLANESSGSWLSGRGVVNYVFAPWLHTAFYLLLRRWDRGRDPAPIDTEAF